MMSIDFFLEGGSFHDVVLVSIKILSEEKIKTPFPPHPMRERDDVKKFGLLCLGCIVK